MSRFKTLAENGWKGDSVYAAFASDGRRDAYSTFDRYVPPANALDDYDVDQFIAFSITGDWREEFGTDFLPEVAFAAWRTAYLQTYTALWNERQETDND